MVFQTHLELEREKLKQWKTLGKAEQSKKKSRIKSWVNQHYATALPF